jgi:DNA-binding NarL/FixJ family response regulator
VVNVARLDPRHAIRLIEEHAGDVGYLRSWTACSTPREREVLTLVAEGRSNKSIG